MKLRQSRLIDDGMTTARNASELIFSHVNVRNTIHTGPVAKISEGKLESSLDVSWELQAPTLPEERRLSSHISFISMKILVILVK